MQSVMRFTQMQLDVDDDLTLIWVGFLGVRFEVERLGGGEGVQLTLSLSKTC